MLRSSRFTPLYAVALAVVVAATFATPAFAHRGGRDHGGKKALGAIVSFDGTTLTVAMVDGTTVAAPVADDVKVKVEHRGRKSHGKGFKKPSNGSLDDLAAGAQVLKMKLTCGEVDKLRLRRAPTPAEPTVTAASENETAVPSTEAIEDDGCGSDDADEAEADESDDAADATEDADDSDEDGSDDDDASDDESADEASDDLLEEVTEVVDTPTL